MTNMNDETVDSYPLDDATLELMAETLQQIKTIHAIREGVLMLFVRQQRLSPGDWQLSDNGKELRRVDGRNRVNGLQSQPPKQPDPPSDLEQQLAESIKNVKRS